MATAGQKKENSGDKLRTLADSDLFLDPVTVTENMMAQVKDEQEKISQEELLNKLKKLDTLQNRELNVFSCDNVYLIFIEPDGDVKTTFEQCKLTIFRVQGDETDTIFLRVGTWVYPLFSELSPCYRSSEGIFIFPDIHSNVEGAAVGLLLPEEECNALHEVLTEILGNQDEGRVRRSAAGDAAVSVSANINRGSSYLSRNLVRASGSLAGYIDSATSHALRYVQPQAVYVSPKVENAAQVARTASGNTAKAMGYLSSGLCHAVTALGKYISPYVDNLVKDQVPHNAVQFTDNICHGIGNIYNGLEQSAEILTRSLSNNAVKIVEHRYGQSVGHVTSDVLSTIGYIYAARQNVNMWKPKSIAKVAMKSAGQAIIEDRREYLRQQQQQQSSIPQ